MAGIFVSAFIPLNGNADRCNWKAYLNRLAPGKHRKLWKPCYGALLGEPLAVLKHFFGFALNTGGGFNVFKFGAIDRLSTIRRRDGYYRCINTCIHVASIYIYIHVYIILNVFLYICIYVYMYICIYVYMYICIYVYRYICIYVNMYMYIYIYPFLFREKSLTCPVGSDQING